VLWTLDRIVVPTALVAAFIRLGNLMNSEIYGIQTTLPWGFIFERNGETVAKHPTQIYEALAYLFTFVVLMYMYWKTRAKNREGLIFGFSLLLFLAPAFLLNSLKKIRKLLRLEWL
jgi:phosphatidylglycerol---prolipoprotein diacylglyceryl transferase